MMPCSPAMTFCSIVGHASFQTAWPMGPSTMERSNFFCISPGSATDARRVVVSGFTLLLACVEAFNVLMSIDRETEVYYLSTESCKIAPQEAGYETRMASFITSRVGGGGPDVVRHGRP